MAAAAILDNFECTRGQMVYLYSSHNDGNSGWQRVKSYRCSRRPDYKDHRWRTTDLSIQFPKFLNSVLMCAGLYYEMNDLPKTHQLRKIAHPLWLFGQSI